MRIVHATSSFLPTLGGAEIALHNIALRQHLAGHSVTVICPWQYWQGTRGSVPYRVIPLIPLSLDVYYFGVVRDMDLRAQLSAQIRLLRWALRPHVWHVHIAYPTGTAMVDTLSAVKGVTVLTCQGADIQTLPEIGYGARLDPLIDRRIAATIPKFDRVTAISGSIREEYLRLGAPADRIRDVANGVDVTRIGQYPVDRDRVRARLGIPQNRTLILTVGRNHPKKGYELIPEMVKRLVERRTDFLWLVVGRNSEPLLREASRLGVEEYFEVRSEIGSAASSERRDRYLLPSPELVDVYKAADIFAFPSRLEGFPLACVEAMAAGLPLVTTDAPGCRDVVEPGSTGLMSSVGDVDEMARNLLQLLDDPEQRDRMGKAAAAEAIRYDWSRIVDSYLRVYAELVLPDPLDRDPE